MYVSTCGKEKAEKFVLTCRVRGKMSSPPPWSSITTGSEVYKGVPSAHFLQNPSMKGKKTSKPRGPASNGSSALTEEKVEGGEQLNEDKSVAAQK